jgi:hypothetical protein
MLSTATPGGGEEAANEAALAGARDKMADIDGVTRGEAANETPRSAAWWLGGFAVAGGVSALVHLALVGTVLFATPKLLGPAPVNSMTVDIVSPDEIAAMTKNAAEPATPQGTATDKPAPSTPAPSIPPQPPPPAQAPPVSGLDPYAMLGAPPPTAPAPPGPALGEAARLAQLLGLPTPMAGAVTGGGPSEYQAGLTPEEIAEFSAHVQTCWAAPAGVANAPKLQVVIRVSLRPDGGLTASPALLAAPASAQGPALVKAAMRALQQCQPYNALPAGKYDEWRLLDLRFSAEGMSTVSPVPSDQRPPRQPG